MAPLAGKYQQVRNENLLELLKAQGIPDDEAKKTDSLHPTLEFVVDGNNYKLLGGLSDHSIVYKLNEEVEEHVGENNLVYKCTATLNGKGNLVVVTKLPSGHTAKAEYKPTDSSLEIVTSSSRSGSIVAKVFYQRV